MRQSLGILAAMALMTVCAASATADNPWTTTEYSFSNNTYTQIAGELVYGTFTYDMQTTYRQELDPDTGTWFIHQRVHHEYHFLSSDGTITGRALATSTLRIDPGSTRTSTYNLQWNFIKHGEGLIDQKVNRYHETWNANGELKVFRFDYGN